ncbi:MAG: hypothetical protein QXT19_01650 [Candidatus Woesearchaeota archaeon]
MCKGLLIGAIISFLIGLSLQAYSPWVTEIASLSPEGAHILAVSFVAMLFVASSYGIIGAFIGAVLEEGFVFFKH